MNLNDIDHIQTLSLDAMVAELVTAKDKLKTQEKYVYYVERSLIETMQARGATVAKTSGGTATLTTAVTYDYSKLAMLREITEPQSLTGYTPAHEETTLVPEKWDMTRAKPMSRLSTEHAQIISSAQIPGKTRVKLGPAP